MAYTKQTWNTGDVITAEKLNHMEDGIGGNVFIANLSEDDGTTVIDETYNEIVEAFDNGKSVYLNNFGVLYPYACFIESDSSIEFGLAHGVDNNGVYKIVYELFRINTNSEVDTYSLELYQGH